MIEQLLLFDYLPEPQENEQLLLFKDLHEPQQVKPAKESFKEKLYRFLAGDDIFISYARADAMNYAPALAARLKDYICFLDQIKADAGEEISAVIMEKIRRSTAFVLIGTEAATRSKAVQKEIEEFRKTGRPIIPITFGDSLQQAKWFDGYIKGMSLATETQEARESGTPSDTIIRRIENSFKYTRRSRVLRYALWGTIAFVLLSIGMTAGWSFFQVSKAQAQERQALETAQTAKEQEAAAKTNEQSAIYRTAEAATSLVRSQSDAAVAKVTALIAKQEAETATERAVQASTQAALAEASARKQQEIASAIEQSNHAEELRDGQLVPSVMLSGGALRRLTALEVFPTAASQTLRMGLRLLPVPIARVPDRNDSNMHINSTLR